MLMVEGVSCFASGTRTGGMGGTLDPHYTEGHPHPQAKKVTPSTRTVWCGWPVITTEPPREAKVLGLEF